MRYMIHWPAPVGEEVDDPMGIVESELNEQEFIGATWGSAWDAFVARGGRLTVLDGDAQPFGEGFSELVEPEMSPQEGQGDSESVEEASESAEGGEDSAEE